MCTSRIICRYLNNRTRQVHQSINERLLGHIRKATLYDLPFNATSLLKLQGDQQWSSNTQVSARSQSQRHSWLNRGQPVKTLCHTKRDQPLPYGRLSLTNVGGFRIRIFDASFDKDQAIINSIAHERIGEQVRITRIMFRQDAQDVWMNAHSRGTEKETLTISKLYYGRPS